MDWFIGKARRKDKDPSPAQQEETKQYLHTAMLECTTSEVKLREIVNLAEGLDYNEWLASHIIAFFEHINLLYGTISEFCSMSGCPDMSGPCNRQYLWVDERGKRCKVAAPQYIDYVMTYAQKTINDESIFPTKFDKEFPSTFESIVKKIMKLLYHVIAHIYHSHFKEIVLLNLHPHLNCIFAHIVLFNERFKLIEEKELEVLHDLAVALKLYPPNLICDTTQEIDIASATFNTRPNGSDDNNNAMTSDYCPTGGSVITTPCRSMGGPFAEVTDKSLCDVSLAPVDDSLVDSSEMKENNNDNLHCYGLGHEDYCVNSPMLVDEPEMSSPEPMLVEPMSSSENLPKKCIIDTTNSLRGRSISANAVLSPSKSLEAFPISPITRRCNSDRTSAKSNSALFYQSTDSPRGPLFQTTSYDTRAGCGR